ncbi:MAG: RnfABCDGE type electron transport complex subunit B [Gammaproteobacteria bacterium]
MEKFTAIAVIDEQQCIGCTKCLPACPVDAIVGSAKHMHTVLAAECTGCGLCLPPCPVDCIVMQPLQALPGDAALRAKIALADHRHAAQSLRRAQELATQQQRAKARKAVLAKIRPAAARHLDSGAK